MMAPTHQLFGTTFGLIAFFMCQATGIVPNNMIEFILFFFFTLIGSLLPDMDTPKSKMGSKFPFILISIPMNLIFGHRNITHSFIFVGVVAAVSFSMVGVFSWSWFYAFGLTLGVLSHVIGDYFFEGGVPLLYPLKKRFKTPFTFKTNGFFEFVIAVALIFINLGLFILLFKCEIFNKLSMAIGG